MHGIRTVMVKVPGTVQSQSSEMIHYRVVLIVSDLNVMH